MRRLAVRHLRPAIAFGLGGLLFFASSQARAFPQSLNAWQARYGADSSSGTNAECQLCFAAADLTFISLDASNCYEGNSFATFFSLIGMLPSCP